MVMGDESLLTRLDRIAAGMETVFQNIPGARDEAQRIKDLVQEIKSTLPTESDFRGVITEVVGFTLPQEQVARLASALVDLTQGRK